MGILNNLFKMGYSRKGSRFYGDTDVGLVRSKNEDYFELLPDRGLYILADGMGGHNAGEVASVSAVKSLCDYFTSERVASLRNNPDTIRSEMIQSVQAAHQTIVDLSEGKPEYGGMGTTLIFSFVHDGALHICHVGDSRAYMVNTRSINQITNDHSGVWTLVKSGEMTSEEARHSPLRNQISQALGAPFPITPEYTKEPIDGSDIVLLCSDGLWDMLSDDEIHSIILDGDTLEHVGKELIRRANEEGGEDNITLVLFRGEEETLN